MTLLGEDKGVAATISNTISISISIPIPIIIVIKIHDDGVSISSSCSIGRHMEYQLIEPREVLANIGCHIHRSRRLGDGDGDGDGHSDGDGNHLAEVLLLQNEISEFFRCNI